MTMQNLQIPETAESRIVPKWLFPPRFSDKDRFTSSRPDFALVTPIAARTQKQQTNVGGWVLRSGRGQLRETGSIPAAGGLGRKQWFPWRYSCTYPHTYTAQVWHPQHCRASCILFVCPAGPGSFCWRKMSYLYEPGKSAFVCSWIWMYVQYSAIFPSCFFCRYY